MQLNIKEEGGFRYIEEGEGQAMVLLHGLFGALSNWQGVIDHFSKEYRVFVPMLPIYELPPKEAGLGTLTDFIEQFIEFKQLKNIVLLGNSLGGHLALMYNLRHPENIDSMVLTGSSGLFEDGMGGSYPKRGSIDFVRKKVQYTFYDPKTATEDLVQEIFEVTQSIPKCLSIVAIAKSAQRNNMAEEITNIKSPTLLVWGLNDTITPPLVAHEFNRLLSNSTLSFIDKCCHAPMMEHPDTFNEIVSEYLKKQTIKI